MVAPACQMSPTSLAAGVHQGLAGRPVRRLHLLALIRIAKSGLETKYVTCVVRTRSVTGMEVTVRSTGTNPGRTAKPQCPAQTYFITAAVTQSATMQAAYSTALNATNIHRWEFANTTNTVQIITPMVIATRAATRKHVAGMVWTVPETLLPSWQTAHW